MSIQKSPFAPAFEDLPDILPIFPLSGVLLLPGGVLPLNIFERRYLNMTADALKSDTRMIGMIQPTGSQDAGQIARIGAAGPEVYPVGCAGRIVSFAESSDGRYLITLEGTARFTIVEECDPLRGYRRVRPDYTPYQADLDPPGPGLIDRQRMVSALGTYFKANGIEPNWNAVDKMPDDALITFLAMGCPFDASEKQALLEAEDIRRRGDILLTLLEMSGGGTGGEPGPEGTRH